MIIITSRFISCELMGSQMFEITVLHDYTYYVKSPFYTPYDIKCKLQNRVSKSALICII